MPDAERVAVAKLVSIGVKVVFFYTSAVVEGSVVEGYVLEGSGSV